MQKIEYSRPYRAPKSLVYIEDVLRPKVNNKELGYIDKCQQWLTNYLNAEKVLLTHSCTAALEIAAILLNVSDGDEIIMPSYTFVSTANAFVLRGGLPVFVDVSKNSCNIDPKSIESAITPKTKAIVVVHYAGISCDMTEIMKIAKKNNLFVVEDAAQALMSSYKKRPLGSIGHLSAFSFHDTKNICSGEGGALSINHIGEAGMAQRAEVIRDKGTNRQEFNQGFVDKYTWVDIGSSYVPSEMTAALLFAQLEVADEITKKRLSLWNNYDNELRDLCLRNEIQVSNPIKEGTHNGHLYYLIMSSIELRNKMIELLSVSGISACFHYIPLHSSDFGKTHARSNGEFKNTKVISDGIIRLPLWHELEESQAYIIKSVKQIITTKL